MVNDTEQASKQVKYPISFRLSYKSKSKQWITAAAAAAIVVALCWYRATVTTALTLNKWHTNHVQAISIMKTVFFYQRN